MSKKSIFSLIQSGDHVYGGSSSDHYVAILYDGEIILTNTSSWFPLSSLRRNWIGKIIRYTEGFYNRFDVHQLGDHIRDDAKIIYSRGMTTEQANERLKNYFKKNCFRAVIYGVEQTPVIVRSTTEVGCVRNAKNLIAKYGLKDVVTFFWLFNNGKHVADYTYNNKTKKYIVAYSTKSNVKKENKV